MEETKMQARRAAVYKAIMMYLYTVGGVGIRIQDLDNVCEHLCPSNTSPIIPAIRVLREITVVCQDELVTPSSGLFLDYLNENQLLKYNYEGRIGLKDAKDIVNFLAMNGLGTQGTDEWGED